MSVSVSWLFLASVWMHGAALPSERAMSGIPSTAVPAMSWESWWDRARPWLGPAGTSDAAPAAGDAWGQLARVRESRDRIPADALGFSAASGCEAILRLGLGDAAERIGHLRSIVEDRLVGRALVGQAAEPLPTRLRIAAALALGISEDDRAFQALRSALLDTDLPDEVGAAAIVALGFALSERDGARFAELLQDAERRPLMAEAAAANLGRHAQRIPGGVKALIDALAGPNPATSRGAALGLWAAPKVSDPAVADALEAAVLNAADPATRILALFALAGHGDQRAQAFIDTWTLAGDPWQEYAVFAAGLLAGADASAAEAVERRLAEQPAGNPEVRAARAWMTGQDRGRGAFRIPDSPAAIAFLTGSPALGEVLAIAGKLPH